MNEKPIFGVVVKCKKGCEHLVAADADYYEAWGKAAPEGALDSARTIVTSRSDPAVQALPRSRAPSSGRESRRQGA